MRWLIDGYNLIRRDPQLSAAEARGLVDGRRALLALLARAARRTGDPVIAVFDGGPHASVLPLRGRVQAVFSRPPETADDVLLRLARQYREGAIVVTSDRTVQHGVRRVGAIALDTGAFLDALEGHAEVDDDDGDDDSDDSPAKRGNPRRRSRDDRVRARALRRLRTREPGEA